MRISRRQLLIGMSALWPAGAATAKTIWPYQPARETQAIERTTPLLETLYQSKSVTLGAPIFIRIFKQERRLEIFTQNDENTFTLVKTYPICSYSGDLGPKLQQGDMQAPEGFYFITKKSLNPHSSFHLSFNLGYPNAYDRAHGRDGDYLMVHGACSSIGCYAMTDDGIEEIYTQVWSAFDKGQRFIRVHIFPFEMTETNLSAHRDNKWYDFWANLKEGYDHFERQGQPPNVTVQRMRYAFSAR